MRIRLPDGNITDHDGNVTPHAVASTIGKGLADAAIGARVNGQLVDVHRQIRDITGDTDQPVELAIITAPRTDKQGRSKWRDEQHEKDALYLLRHSCAHVMAEAITRLWPDTELAYGPPLDSGFYYDLKLNTPISSEDFGRIEDEMKKVVEEDRHFYRYELNLKHGFGYLEHQNKYKKDNAKKAQENGAQYLSWYITGEPDKFTINGEEYWGVAGKGGQHPYLLVNKRNSLSRCLKEFTPLGNLTNQAVNPLPRDHFEDLCQGPHVDHTGRIGAFKIMNVAQSHWHGDITSDAFQRVYGTAFFTQADLDAHLEQLEQARQRDHRVIGPRLGLYTIDEAVGQGLVLWKPNGAVVRQELQNFILGHLERQGYHQVFTPHIGKLGLYKTSGHFPYYQDSQYPPIVLREEIQGLAAEGCSCADLAHRMKEGDIDGYMLKPMNCPHHIRIFASDKHSYRDLPVRLAEFGTVYRWEQSGELGGMTRVRGFTQDDAHLFVTEEQLAKEVEGCLELVKIVFNTLGMDDYRVRVGLRDSDSSKYVGESEQWDRAETACKAAAATLGVPFTLEEGEAAFYGPKIDFVVRDVIGRAWQLGTVQVDYQLPNRFDLSYIGPDNKPHRPVMIHRAPFGSMERFIGCLTEHFNGAFPLWLAPEQVRVLPISDKFVDYADQVLAALRQQRLRATLDDANDRIASKIKAAQEMKVPYMLVVGGKDRDAAAVSVRDRSRGDLGAMPLEAFVQQVTRERDERLLTSMIATSPAT